MYLLPADLEERKELIQLCKCHEARVACRCANLLRKEKGKSSTDSHCPLGMGFA